MTIKHTGGDWSICPIDEGLAILAGEEQAFAEVALVWRQSEATVDEETHYTVEATEAQANAELISKAPAMLNALQDVLLILNNNLQVVTATNEQREQLDKALNLTIKLTQGVAG